MPAFLLACLAALAGAGAGPGAALASAPEITIVTPGGARHALALEALAGTEDVVGRGYALRSSEGETTQVVTGFSIAALLAAAGVDPYGFAYLEVGRPGGGAVLLSRHQALGGGAFPDGPPVVYSTGAGTAFLRPGIGSGDDNAADSFAAPLGLTIALRKGASLQVRVEATPRRTVPGEQVRFRATVVRSGAAERLSWSWYFDDGHSGEGQSAVHSFAKPGSYAVVVGVKAAGEETGTSAVVRVQVGTAPGGGPDRQGGGHNEAATAPDHGAAGGPSRGTSGPGAGAASGGGPSAGPPAGAGTNPAASPATAPTRAASPPAAKRTARPKKGTAKPKDAGAKAGTAKRTATPKAATREAAQEGRPRAERTPQPSGEFVAGELLQAEAAAAAPVVRAARRAAARTGTPRAAGGGGVPVAAWGLGTVALVLGLGALAEAGAFVDLVPRISERLR